jgi:DNA-binding transcriptional MocR family regulator
MKRYEQFAEEISQSIRMGVMKAGDRLPSVRQASRSRNVSASTVFEAYYLLEARGLIRARERSGYYVTAGARQTPTEHATLSEPAGDSRPVDVSELVFSFLESARTRDVVPFASAFPSPLLFPLPRLARSMSAAMQNVDPWASVDDLAPGSAALRRQIALRYLADGLHVHPEEVVVTNGALEALNLCLQAVTKPGDCVLVESPTFYAALQALERLGLNAIQVPTHSRDGIDIAAVERAIARYSPKACWLMTNFQNPLGSLMPDQHKRDLVALLSSHKVPLIEDDVYGELYFGSSRPLPAKAFDKEGWVMHCSSFSKCLAPGYRIGWALPGRFAQAVTRLRVTTSLSPSGPAQAALADYLAKGGFDKHLRQLRHTLAVQQSAMAEAIVRHFPNGTKATHPAGGYFTWVELPQPFDSLTLHQQAISLGISIAPGPIFSATREYGNCMRLNYGHPIDERAQQALAELGRLVTLQTR